MSVLVFRRWPQCLAIHYFGLLAMLALPMVSRSEENPDAANWARCSAIKDDSGRLACYDDVASSLNTAAQASTSKSVAPSESQFGAETVKRQEPTPKGPDQIESEIVGTGGRQLDKLATFRLANGQSWKFLDDRTAYLPAHEHVKVRITRNFIGNYFLKIEDAPATFRVERQN